MFQTSPWQILHSKRTFYFIAAVGFLFKYWLVLGEEIEPFYRPADDLIYAQLAESWYWWAEYSAYSFLRPPIWPLVMAVVDYLGVPLRLFQELLLCGSSFVLINCFRKNGLNALTAGLCFVLIIHHPGWLLLANRTLRECFYVSLLLILVAQLVPFANRRLMTVRWHHLLPVGITSALLWYTREETINIAVILATFIFIFWLLRQELPRWSKVVRQLLWVSLGLLGPVIITGLTIRTANYARHGLFIPHEFAGVSFKRVFKQLMQIRPQDPKPWATVEQESLELAYEVSPTLSSIREALSDRVGPRWAAVSIGQTKDPNEIAGCSFFFALREAAMEEGIHKSALTAHHFYKKIEEELNVAFDEGTLKKRLVLSSYLDPEISDWLPRFPAGVSKIVGFAYKPLQDTDIRIYYPRYDGLRTLKTYDKVTNRRHDLAYRKVPRIRGWAFIEGKEIQSVSVLDHDRQVLDSTTDIYERPDVAAAYVDSNAPQNSGFKITLPKADYPNWDVIIVFETKDGSKATMPANRLLNHGQQQDHDDKGILLRVTVDETNHGNQPYRYQEAIQAWLWINHGRINMGFGCLAILTLIGRYLAYKPRAKVRHFNRWIVFIMFIIAFRSLLITLMDISSFRIDLRYIFPALVFLPLLFGLILQEAMAGMKKNLYRWR